MSSPTPFVRWAIRGGIACVTAALAVAGLVGTAAASVPVPRGHAASADPYSPAYGHPYRHGVVPTIARQAQISRWVATHTARPLAHVPGVSPLNMTYGGGINGVGVTTGHEKVYLVFWGRQWGKLAKNKSGLTTLSGDPSGEAPYLQAMFKGLGTGGETWSGVMTQFCQNVPYNSMRCTGKYAQHVAYPTGGALAGVWVDERTKSPLISTGNQLGSEAITAAHHFGNNTPASNRDAQYVILSPTNTHPDFFGLPSSGFCAWHDDTADPNLPAGPVNSKLDLAFTNMPYVTDLTQSCGEYFVNGGDLGVHDGMSIVEGHEYAETVTDQLPAFGWTDQVNAEVGDVCAWNPPGMSGGTNNLKLPTGTFAMQSIWGNDLNGGVGGCEFSHRTVT